MARTRMLIGADLARAATLRDEGMPASWIAEDLDCRRESIFRSGLPADIAATAEWRSVWSGIRRSPALYELHKEFAPAKEFCV